MTDQELSGLGVDPSELQVAFDYFDAHHLRFVSVIAKSAIKYADASAVKVSVGELETSASSVVGVSPATIALILQIIQAAYPLIAQILSIFLGSLTPKPAPAPAPTPAPKLPAAAASILIGLAMLLFAGTASAAKHRSVATPCDCHDQAAARAAFALSLSLNGKGSASVGAETFRCVCTARGTDCRCSKCDCNCPDALSYAEALRQSAGKRTPIAVWVKCPIDRSVYPEAIHLRDDSFAGAEPGLVVGVWSNGGLGRFDVPAESGTVTRERVLVALGYSNFPAAPSCPDGKCKQ